MEDVINKIKNSITREMSGQPDARREILRNFPVTEEKGHLSYLKDEEKMKEISKLIGNKKMSNNQIKNKIKNYLNDPEDVKDFLIALLKTKSSNKEESKEATATGGGSGAFITALEGGGNMEPQKNVPVVRESEEYCDSCDRVKSKCICDKTKKVETKEATGSASSGSYSQPAIWAKSMKKKDFAGYRKPLYKGGKFVQVKKKCKKFPYCNQGDINALKIFDHVTVKKVIKNISKKHNISENVIKTILSYEYEQRKNKQ
jgi:Glu-tRNA(Gln) amidotransferase subunit E-like FAD-binding protein